MLTDRIFCKAKGGAMKRGSIQFPDIVDIIVILAVTVLTVYIDIGFFCTDSRLLNSVGSHRIVSFLLWSLRVGTVVTGIAVILAYFGLKYRQLSPASVVLALGVAFLTILIAFPFLTYFHGKSFQKNISRFHPYLQLAPPTYKDRHSNSALPPMKIFCLGGSTTEFRDSNGRGWPLLVQEKLRKTLVDRDVQVFNLGRRWYTSLHTLINYQTNLRKHKPDVILVTHAINDLLHNADFSFLSDGPFREDYGHFLGPLYRYVKLRSIANMTSATLDLVWYAPKREVIDTRNFPGLLPFKRNLVTLCDLARADGTRVVLITQPYLIKKNLTEPEKAALVMVNYEAVGPTKRWSYRTARWGMEQYTSCVRQVARETHVELIDLEKVVPKQLDYMYDDVHYTDKAYDLISKVIASQLLELGVVRH